MPMINSAEEFVKLRSSENREEYKRAAHEEADLQVWFDILKKYPDMSEWVVLNKTVPIEILESLIDHSDRRVRFAVAMKRKLTHEMFEKLSIDKNETVRGRIVHNTKTPIAILKQLTNDKVTHVAEDAKRLLAERIKNIK